MALASIGAPRLANPDAETLSHVLGSLGWQVTADRINVALMVLGVLVLEVGGGVAAVVGAALSRSASPPSVQVNTTAPAAPAVSAVPAAAPEHQDIAANTAPALAPVEAPQNGRLIGGDAQDTVADTATRAKVLAMIKAAGGTVRGAQRSMASQIGVSPSRFNAVLSELSTAGLVKVRAGSTGTVLTVA